jgi:hypothetical protein
MLVLLSAVWVGLSLRRLPVERYIDNDTESTR